MPQYPSQFHAFVARVITNTCNETGTVELEVFTELVVLFCSPNRPPRGLERVLEGLGYPVINGEIQGLSIRDDRWYKVRFGSLERALTESRSEMSKKFVKLLMNT